MTASAASAKIAKVQRAIAAAEARLHSIKECSDGECTVRINRNQLDCLANAAHCTTALAAILPSLPSLSHRRATSAVATEDTGCTWDTAAADPPPPRPVPV
ncbi:hypothetical protein DLJ53_22405 [Acuticoccus sediminis]|uniref:Uncharacterized protein n=2 Tax=Acuticoccus sediminis TaxID=2184697 RepID=A0A8B2NQ16_9HYPH|nr:hypothetical protein [Acuticoccus sediminis]RAH99292.1 hypothetical protein DLJ53_22405 [Acuticoccus sediminis]